MTRLALDGQRNRAEKPTELYVSKYFSMIHTMAMAIAMAMDTFLPKVFDTYSFYCRSEGARNLTRFFDKSRILLAVAFFYGLCLLPRPLAVRIASLLRRML
jgi:hypothetical protein